MTGPNLPYALHGLLIVGVFVGWFYSCWQDYAVERGRQHLFELRDRWFDLATANPQWRDHPASRMVRALFNAQIRSLRRFSLPAMLLALLMPRVQRREAAALVESALCHLPDVELRQQARRLQDEALLRIGCALVQRSLAVWVATLLLLPVALPGLLVMALASKLGPRMRKAAGPVAPASRAGGLRGTTLRTPATHANVVAASIGLLSACNGILCPNIDLPWGPAPGNQRNIDQ